MSGSASRLYAVTRALPEVPSQADLLAYADPHDPLLWLHGDRSAVAQGVALRLRFQGSDRFTEAARAWRQLVETAVVDDPIGRTGTGLVAFGTFAFADVSATESLLMVPETIVVRRGDLAWVTRISTQPITEPPTLPRTEPLGPWQGGLLPTEQPDTTYLAGVANATARIGRGEAQKIVLARRVQTVLASSDDLRVALERLAQRYDECVTFAIDGFVGASPETLVRQRGGAITARVLAGTRGRKTHEPADLAARDELLANSKEQYEHALAVQSVVTALSPHVSALSSDPEPFALQLPNVWHLATDLRATPAPGTSSLDLIDALHPTAAVAGTPTREAVAAIAALEPFDRERYAGAVGWIDATGNGEWVIGLRSAQLGPTTEGMRTLTAYAGGGILSGSIPDREFHETVSKLKPIAEAFSP